MNPPSKPARQSTWYLVIGLMLGLAAGLLYSWRLAPVKFIDTSPASLRSDFKDEYRLLIASAYQSTGDLGRAEARLALLNDPDPVAALTGQAQHLLASGGADASASALLALADGLGQTAGAATPGAGISPATTAALLAASTPLVRPSATPTVTPGAPFAVGLQENVCNPALPPGLLQVEVRNAAGQPVAGIEIVLAWSGGEQHFFTGLKPAQGNGYADAIMTPGTIYSVQLANNSAAASNVTPPTCPGSGGKSFAGAVHLVFQQP